MSVTKNEPAFPIIGACADHQYCGMSLRDYFAAKVSAAMVSTITSDESYYRLRMQADNAKVGLSEWIAMESYKQADALLAHRN